MKSHKILLFALVCAAIGLGVVSRTAKGADQKVIRDNNQRVIGTIRQDPVFKDREIVRDRYERPVATIQKGQGRGKTDK